MKKIKFSLLLLALCLSGFSQDLYKVNKSTILFFSEAPLENIEATNSKAQGLINLATKKVAFIVPIVEFNFEKSLMEEHFNENYMESAKFKTGSFNGDIITEDTFKKDGTYEVEVSGILTIHGVTKKRTIKGILTKNKEALSVVSEFDVALADYNIKIPKMVIKNIAENVQVKVDLSFELKK